MQILQKQEQKEAKLAEIERKREMDDLQKRAEAEEAESFRHLKKREAEQLQEARSEAMIAKYRESEQKIVLKSLELERQR